MNQTASFVALLLAVAIWGGNYVVVKIGVTEWHELPFVALRFWIATISFLPFISFSRFRTPDAKLENSGLLRVGVLAGISLFAAYILQAFALTRSTASKAAFLTTLFVIFVPLIQAVRLRRWPIRHEVLGCIIAWIGVGVLVHLSLSAIQGSDILLVGSALCYAFQIIIVGSLKGSARSIDFTAIQLATVALCSTLVSLPNIFSGQVRFPSVRVIAAVAFTGIVASALAYFLQAYAQRQVTATQAGVLFTFEPVFAAVASVLFMNEHLSLRTVVGGSLIVFATIICSFPNLTGSRVKDRT